ncbi:hypothetical protein FPSE_10048 [Fusarium pseudograminearum CS3096]|uniref:Mid2 domain-containing protein n=1 Tax=Fusarium pseudograminearum (strain CS3096) TaxID=1028729 RepID=K3V861_FUSPC|nr:hypothetical protein FPSE_10048 [Fusarium pseudograminearum CS3096]EKJ69732.1 hypothetical protein FPSE_10048 [Fusarium pseudograminearum CS3096]
MKSDWYSPGVCPNRYVYAATAVSTHTNAPATTFAICCLSDVPTAVYNLQPVVCYRSMTGDIADSFTFTAAYPGISPTTDIYVPAIMIAWQHSDLSRFDPKSALVYDLKRAKISLRPDPFTETASEFASSTLPSDRSSISYTNEFPTSTSKTKDQDESSEGGSHGLSTGATAGIGVGAAIAGMAVVGFLWWFTKRYRVLRKDKNTAETGQTWDEQMYKPPGIVDKPVNAGVTPRTELP